MSAFSECVKHDKYVRKSLWTAEKRRKDHKKIDDDRIVIQNISACSSYIVLRKTPFFSNWKAMQIKGTFHAGEPILKNQGPKILQRVRVKWNIRCRSILDSICAIWDTSLVFSRIFYGTEGVPNRSITDTH